MFQKIIGVKKTYGINGEHNAVSNFQSSLNVTHV